MDTALGIAIRQRPRKLREVCEPSHVIKREMGLDISFMVNPPPPLQIGQELECIRVCRVNVSLKARL
jgi:hypothetical protein